MITQKGPGLILFLSIFLITLFSCKTEQGNQAVVSRSAEDAISGLKIADDLEVQLFASEPMVVNPTNIDIDTRGRVWATEGVNYRMHLNPGNPEKPSGDRVVILEDTDGDGKADISKTFVQDPEINSALGICVLGHEVIVSCSPNILKFTDIDGDDVADRKDTLFTGIGGFQHDHGAHAFTFGPDGKLYFNFGNSGEQLLDLYGEPVKDQLGRPIKADGKPYRQGMVFRCDPDGQGVEVLGHNFRNNYEVAVDAFGTLWQSDNDDDGNRGVRINYVMPYGNYGYRDEMTGAGWRAFRTGMHEEIPLRHWHQNDPGVVPNLLQTGAGSPCGMIVYEGDLLPARFINQMIHCDAGPNVVRAYPVVSDGAGYKASIEPLIEAGTDKWFRPVDVGTAPDGSLFIADWYDPGVGGHKVGDLERGRIFRITTKNRKTYEIPEFDWENVDQFIEALKNPNLAIRHKAYYSLKYAEDESEEKLIELFNSDNPRFQARALWILASYKNGEKHLQTALKSSNSDIRITAFRAIQSHFPEKTLQYSRDLLEDGSNAMLREIALAQYMHPDPLLWAKMAQKYDGKDPWYLEALGIGATNQMDKAFDAYMSLIGNQWDTDAGKQIVWRMRTPKTLPLLSKLLMDEKEDGASKVKYFRAMDFQSSGKKNNLLLKVAQKHHPSDPEIRNTALSHLSPEFVKSSAVSRKMLKDILPEMSGSITYLRIVESLKLTDQVDGLIQTILNSEDNSLKAQATRLLLDLNGSEAIEVFLTKEDGLEKWKIIQALSFANNGQALQLIESLIFDENQSPVAKKAAVQAMGQGWGGEHRLFKLMEEGKLPEDLSLVAANRLTSAIDGSLRQKALEYLGKRDENEELPSIDEIVSMKGNLENGEIVFQKNCSICHQVNGEGTNFGPNLSQIGDKLSPEALLSSIIYPGEGINFGYEGYIIKLKDGSVFSGFIESQTEDQLSLRMNGGISQNISLDQIESQDMLGQSLMPEGFHLNLSKKDLSDLVSYLGTLKKNAEIASN